ncbi:MAG: histone deacetylase family protein [Nocardioidaceae bacterium]|jgi:acetoin utilization deacetylase AcuC-like enzyme|nr:histone deacetylase family protein [Nocardioidaceae bacterium]
MLTSMPDRQALARVVWSPVTKEHLPGAEVWVGVVTPGSEVPGRVDVIRGALERAGHRCVEAQPHRHDALLAVHDSGLVAHLEQVHDEWLAGEYVELVGQDRVVPYVFPTAAMLGGLPMRAAAAVHARAGQFGYDTMTLVGAGTWPAARAAVDCALTAVDLVRGGEPVAYALCRPPGHHVTRAAYGGSCYLNNAAVAAQALRDAAHRRVAVVDVDAHHGNGTAAIFYERGDVAYGSVHVDPGAGWFPHFVGFAEETGRGDGEGATLNLPLPPGTGDEPWLAAVDRLAGWVSDLGADALVVSLGVDAAVDDPESPLLVTADAYHGAGARLAALGLPTVVVQEGGYHLPSLGGLVAAYLAGHHA